MKSGDLILVKSSFLFGYLTKDRLIDNNVVEIRPFSFFLLLDMEINDKNKTTIISCFYEGKKRYMFVENNKIKKYFSVIEIPKNVNMGDNIDLWITNHMNVHGQAFYFSGKNIKVCKGWYPNKEPFIIEHIIGKDNEPFVGLSIKRNASKRKLVFEFLHNNKIYWKEFNNSKRGKDKFEDNFLRLKKYY